MATLLPTTNSYARSFTLPTDVDFRSAATLRFLDAAQKLGAMTTLQSQLDAQGKRADNAAMNRGLTQGLSGISRGLDTVSDTVDAERDRNRRMQESALMSHLVGADPEQYPEIIKNYELERKTAPYRKSVLGRIFGDRATYTGPLDTATAVRKSLLERELNRTEPTDYEIQKRQLEMDLLRSRIGATDALRDRRLGAGAAGGGYDGRTNPWTTPFSEMITGDGPVDVTRALPTGGRNEYVTRPTPTTKQLDQANNFMREAEQNRKNLLRIAGVDPDTGEPDPNANPELAANVKPWIDASGIAQENAAGAWNTPADRKRVTRRIEQNPHVKQRFESVVIGDPSGGWGWRFTASPAERENALLNELNNMSYHQRLSYYAQAKRDYVTLMVNEEAGEAGRAIGPQRRAWFADLAEKEFKRMWKSTGLGEPEKIERNIAQYQTKVRQKKAVVDDLVSALAEADPDAAREIDRALTLLTRDGNLHSIQRAITVLKRKLAGETVKPDDFRKPERTKTAKHDTGILQWMFGPSDRVEQERKWGGSGPPVASGGMLPVPVHDLTGWRGQ